MATKAKETRPSEPAAVDAYMAKLEHPLAAVGTAIRNAIASLDELKARRKTLVAALKAQIKHLK